MILLEIAEKTAAEIIELLRPLSERIEIVCMPHPGKRRAITDTLPKSAAIQHDGRDILRFNYADIQVDIFFAHGVERDLLTETPSNWGSVLLTYTGPKWFNARLASTARTKGLTFRPYIGLMRDEQIIASATEEEIFKALELPFLTPENRLDT
jgi:DNA polymerase (family 10)